MMEIRYGLGGIKGIPKETAKAIERERKANGPYKDLFDLVSRVDRTFFSRRTLLSLIQAGVFDSLEPNRAKLAANIDNAISLSESESANAAQESLFGDFTEDVAPEYVDAKPWSAFKELCAERDVMGCLFRGHFFGAFEEEAKKLKCTRLIAVRPAKKGDFRAPSITVAGVVSNIRSSLSKDGKPMGSFIIDDGTAQMSVNCFGDSWLQFRNIVKNDEVVFVTGRAREDKFSPSGIGIAGNRVEVPAVQRAKQNMVLELTITDPNLDFDALRVLLQSHKPEQDDTGCRVAVKLQNKQYQGAVLMGKEWQIYADQSFEDELAEFASMSYRFVPKESLA
jgi:DNA polymerase-3 subunit alpha